MRNKQDIFQEAIATSKFYGFRPGFENHSISFDHELQLYILSSDVWLQKTGTYYLPKDTAERLCDELNLI